MSTWILTADAAEARIYASFDRGHTIELIRELQNPRGRAKGSELRTDKPGRIQNRGAATHVSAIDPHTAAHEVEVQHFAHELAQILDHEHEQRKFTSLILVAAPHLLGLLRKEINPAVARSIGGAVDKDLMHLTLEELREQLASEFFAQAT